MKIHVHIRYACSVFFQALRTPLGSESLLAVGMIFRQLIVTISEFGRGYEVVVGVVLLLGIIRVGLLLLI